MKNIFLWIVFLLTLFSCQNSKEKERKSEINSVSEEKSNAKIVSYKSNLKTTYLCKVNGKDWGYTKASGIVVRNKNTGKRSATITFKRKLEKGSESIQLTYDGDSFQLERASLILKFPKKGGGLVSGHYSLHPDTRDQNPESNMSGTIDLSNASLASGNAELSKFNMKYEWSLLEDPKNRVVTISGLNFKDVGYSDVNKTFEKMGITKK